MKGGYVALIIVSVLVFVIILVSCLATSIYYIKPNEVGLFKHKWTKSLSEKPLPPGRYCKPPMNTKIQFPTSLISHSFVGTEYNVNTRTADGLELALNVEVYIRLMYDSVREVYLIYGPGYDEFVRSEIKGQIRNVGNKYGAEDYQTRFTEIADAISNRLRTELPKMGFELGRISITSYDLPDSYESVLLDIAVADQDYDIAEEEMRTEQTALQVMLEKSIGDTDISIASEKGKLDNKYIEETNRLNAKQNILAVEANSLAMLLTKTVGPNEVECGTNKYNVHFNNLDYYTRLMLYSTMLQAQPPVQSADPVYARV